MFGTRLEKTKDVLFHYGDYNQIFLVFEKKFCVNVVSGEELSCGFSCKHQTGQVLPFLDFAVPTEVLV